MRNTVLAAAVAVALTLSAADASAQTKGAATKAEVQSIQAQMQALADRLNKLEAANASLQTENAALKETVERRDAETDYLKAQTKELRTESAQAQNEIAKVKGADWATRIKLRGDLRYRSENIWTERVDTAGAVVDASDRYRQRIRARLGFDATVTDTLKATLLLATGGDDPRSSNQTLGSTGTRKAIGLDMAYADWKFLQGGNLVLGKQPQVVWRPGQSLFYDNDFNPEGGAVKFERGILFGNAYGWWLTEQNNADPNLDITDAYVAGLQGGVKFPLFDGETVLAANYYECIHCVNQSPLYLNASNGNTTYKVGTGTTNLLTYGYDILEIGGQMGFSAFDLPFTLWANYAQNMAEDVEFDTAYAGGVTLGKASNPRTWEAGVLYQSVDKDALFGQFVDSDFGGGNTDAEGWVLKGAYAPVRNFTIAGTYFLNTINKDVGTELDYSRLQLDLNYKF